jgi:TPR repeat protein
LSDPVRRAGKCGDNQRMRGRRLIIAVLAAVALAVIAVVASAVLTAGRFGWPAWIGVSVSAVVGAAAASGRQALGIISDWPLASLRRSLDQGQVLKGTPGYRRQVGESASRVALGIHPAIPLPPDAPQGLSDEFPVYVPRDLDADVRAWIRSRVPDGGLMILAGPAGAGKSRLLTEALLAEVPGWQLLRPDASQVNGLVSAGADLSRSVLWLDEFQTFFVGEPLSVKSVGALLAGRHGPVLLAATIRAEERGRLLRAGTIDQARQMNLDAYAILRMTARWSGRPEGTERAVLFDVAGQLSAQEQARASAFSSRDPRLEIALRHERGSDLVATLACEAELVARWRAGSGDPAGQALITAAVVARRCGHPEPIPESVLAAVALASLSAEGTAPEARRWLLTALAWAQAPVLPGGQIAAIRAVRTVPGRVEGYHVSDILLQSSHDHEYPDVRRLLEDEGTWDLVLGRASRPAVPEIALSAYNAKLTAVARRAWQTAAGQGDSRAARDLGLLCWEQQVPEAEAWLRKAVELGSVDAMSTLGLWLADHSQPAEAEQVLTRAATLGDPTAMLNLGITLSGRGEEQEGERWTRRAAELGDAVAMTNLGYQLLRRGAFEEGERWSSKAAAEGSPGAMENLGRLCQDRGDLEAALAWYRQGAERGYADVQTNPRHFRPWPGEGSDTGVSDAILQLAKLLSRLRQDSDARDWYRRGAEIGDARAAAALAADSMAHGDPLQAAAWRRQAAVLALANLTRNQASLRTAYGESAILQHTAIMIAYADDLARDHHEHEAITWYSHAASFGDATAAERCR